MGLIISCLKETEVVNDKKDIKENAAKGFSLIKR